MTDETNAPLAGESDDNAMSILDLDNEMESNEVRPAEAASAEAEDAEDETAVKAAPEEAEDAPSDEDERVERLRDNSTTTVREMKEAVEFRRNFERQKAEVESQFAAREAQLKATEAQYQQQSEFLSQTLPLAIQVATENLPPEPHPDLLHTDPMLHYEMSNRRQQAVAKLQALHQQQSVAKQQLEAKQKEAMAQFAALEQQKLFQWKPELKDPAKGQEFLQKVTKVSREVGFTDAEIGNVYDHRLLRMAELAAIGLEVISQKPKVEAKVKEAPPVIPPARRVTTAERQGKELRDQLSRLRKTGSARDAESVLSRFD